MFEQLPKYIQDNYPRAGKIVEVGVGHRIDVSMEVKRRLPFAEVIITDKDEAWIRTRRTPKVKAVLDDVVYPSLPVYQGAGLIYSLHPPVELIPPLMNLAERVGADLLVVPVTDEQEALHEEKWKKVIREGKTVGWLFSRR